jgi:hypothetical protein
MKKFLSILLLLISTTCYSQSGIRIYLEKPNILNRQAIIFFSDTCTDELDYCCDGTLFGGNLNTIWTTTGSETSEMYVINCLNTLTEDRDVPIGAMILPDTGLFIIGINQTYGENLPCVLLDNQVPGYHPMPYYCQGPVLNERFSIHFELPMQIEVVNDCDLGYVVIDNDEPSIGYTLIPNNDPNSSYILPASTDTIFDLPSGEYTLCSNDEIPEQITFVISNTIIDATLHIPYTTVYIGDSYITPILNIYSSYNNILWDFGDGTTLYNDINPVHYYSQAGIYTLKVIVSEGQCSKMFESYITVENVNGIQVINKLQYRPTSNFYSIDGKLVKKL